jgi:succinate dehydrogenase hydrophobic anchor subunit
MSNEVFEHVRVLLDFLAMPQISAAIITASVAFIVGVVAAVLTPAATSLRARRQAIQDKFDAAIAALLLVQAARHAASGMAQRPAGWTDEEHREFNFRMHERSITYYLDKTAEAKAALAALQEYVPEVRPQITGSWELREADEPALKAAIEKRRGAALRSERVFRQRRSLDS